MEAEGRIFWRKQARLVARFVNFFWWVEKTLPLWLGLNLVGVCGVLVARRWVEVGSFFWILYGGAVVAVSLLGYFRSRRKYIGFENGISRLDRVYALNGALCAASQGIVAWPARIERKVRRYDVTFTRIHVTFGLSFVVLAAGLLWPIKKAGDGVGPDILNGPQAWAEMEDWLNVMEASQLIDEESLNGYEEKLDTLENQPKEDWYSDGSLEATDFLLSQSEEATLQFLNSLEMALQSASRLAGDSSSGPQGEDGQQLNKSLDELDLGTLALREDLMKALSELANSEAGSVDQKTLQEMLDRMKEGAETARKGLGMPNFEMKPMYGKAGTSDGEDGEDGPTPLTISDNASPDIAGGLEGISNDDRERAILGDTTFTSEVRIADFDPGKTGMEAGNRTHNLGKGGSAVWKTRARPKEETLLKNYFSNE